MTQTTKAADTKPEDTKPADTKAAPKNERVTVTFTKPHGRYSRGDVAGFAADIAERLVTLRVAVKGNKLPAKAESNPES